MFVGWQQYKTEEFKMLISNCIMWNLARLLTRCVLREPVIRIFFSTSFLIMQGLFIHCTSNNSIKSEDNLGSCFVFFPGPYPEPYIFILSSSEIEVIDLLTHDKTVVISGLQDCFAMAVDIAQMKLYFEDSKNISRANFDGSNVEVILQKVDISNMVIDWIAQRIFWISSVLNKRIFAVNFNGKDRRILLTTPNYPTKLAVDPTVG